MPGAIRFESVGRGDALVLLPGAACAPSIFAPAMERLASHHTVHAAAVAGFGGETPVEPPLYPKLVSTLVSHLDATGPAVLVGHSLGGTLALSAALEAPALVTGIVVIEGAPALAPLIFGTEDLEVHVRRIEASRRRARDDTGYTAWLVASMRPMFCHDGAFEAFGEEAVLSDAMAVADAMGYATKMDLRPRMAEISAPVLLVLGEWPRVDTEARDEAIWAQLEDCPRRTRVRISGSAHFPMTERPDAFVDALERFLAEELR